MKTVKDHLMSLDTDRLVEDYFRDHCKALSEYYYGGPLDDEVDERINTMTISEFAEDQLRLIREYIEYLKGIEITEVESGKQGIIYAYSVLDGDWISTVACTELVYMDELLEDPENCADYDYMLNKFSEILGFLVADNKYTQAHIYEVMSDVLWEASWTGYRQEGLQEELDDLEEFENAKEEELHHYESVEDMGKQLLGADYYREMQARRPLETEESKKFLEEANRARIDYKLCSRKRERTILLNLLKGE